MSDNPAPVEVSTAVSPQSASAPQHTAEESAAHDEIMRQIFGEVGELQNDFSCAVESTVLLHGRMYITDKFICFYSNLFGMEKKIRIPYSHITLITKEKTALVIPNAIAITTYRKEYIFRSFWDRDECFEMLKAFIKTYKGVPGSTPAATSTPAGSGAAPVGSSPVVPATGSPDSTGMSRVPSAQSDPSPKRNSTSSNGDVDEVDSLVGSEPKAQSTAAPVNMLASFNEECAKNKLKVVVISGEKVSVGFVEFIEKFVDDGAPYSLQRHHELIGDLNMNLTKWTAPVGGEGDPKVITTSTRDMKFLKVVNLPGLKQTRGIKIQKCQRFGNMGLILQTSTRLDDVPMADSFSVEESVVVRPVGDGAGGEVTVEMYLEVKFIKYTMLKSLIESNTHGEVTKWLQEYFAAWRSFISGPSMGVGGDAAGGDPAKDMALFGEESSKSRLKVPCFSNEIINISLKDFLANFVEDSAPYDLTKHHTACGDNSMVLPVWARDQYDSFSSARTMTFMKVCNLPGLKQTRAAKTQRWSRCGGAGTVIYTCTKLDDVPFADVFTVDDCFIVKAVGPNQVSVEATMEVKYVKSTMMKTFIDGSTNKEVIAWCSDYLAALRKHAATIPGSAPLAELPVTKTAVAVVSDRPTGAGGPLQAVDDFVESFGFAGGRYIVVMFIILFVTILFFAFAWRGSNAELYQLRQEVNALSVQMKELLAQNQQLVGQCTMK